jgi:hypothetical protein
MELRIQISSLYVSRQLPAGNCGWVTGRYADLDAQSHRADVVGTRCELEVAGTLAPDRVNSPRLPVISWRRLENEREGARWDELLEAIDSSDRWLPSKQCQRRQTSEPS